MNAPPNIPAFGIVDPDGEHGVFSVETGTGASCRLTLVARTERGYPRRELAVVPAAVWRQVAGVVQREILRGMDPEETGPKAPTFHTGEQILSPLVSRELALILWALMEDGEGTHIEALLAGWRQLAREERWWLYARASNPSQSQGHGWRRALYYALTDPADTRNSPRLLEIMETASAQKKTSAPTRPASYWESVPKKRAAKKSTPTSTITQAEDPVKKVLVSKKTTKLPSPSKTPAKPARKAAKKAARLRK
jgi:hypothetical protein